MDGVFLLCAHCGEGGKCIPINLLSDGTALVTCFSKTLLMNAIT